MLSLRGIDLVFKGRSFTWKNRQEGSALIKERIDRAVAYASWVEAFSQTSVRHLRMEKFDHCHILLQIENVENNVNRPFRLFQAWTPDASSKHVVFNVSNEDDKE